MSVDELQAAPVLSTYQDESFFRDFDKVNSKSKERTHLKHYENYDDLIESINDYYNVDDLVGFLSSKDDKGEFKYKNVTLQFPDTLVVDSALVVDQIEKKLGIINQSSLNKDEISLGSNKYGSCCKSNESGNTQKLWVLADTSYSACCVDEVAAQHVGGDLVVHFGNTCLNAVDRIDSVYVLGKPKINEESLIKEFKLRFPDANQKIVLMADAPNTRHIKVLFKTLKPEYPNLVYTDLHIPTNSRAYIVGYQPEEVNESDKKMLNRILVDSDDPFDDNSMKEYDLFHVTVPEAPRLLQLTTVFQSVTLYDPREECITKGSTPNLMKRYRILHSVRSANTIGLLVNTLSLSNTRALINTISSKIKSSGKKHYTFVVGKPNVAKLANFADVDLWCVLGCDHQGIIIDQYNDYFKPIATPYELSLALGDDVTWTGKWVTDFKKVMDEFEREDAFDKAHEDNGSDSESEAPEFDPVTGKLVSDSKPLKQLKHLQISVAEDNSEVPQDTKGSNALMKKFGRQIAVKNTVSTSASRLQERSWTGLGSDFDTQEYHDQEGSIAEEGSSGIARGYNFDVQVRSK